LRHCSYSNACGPRLGKIKEIEPTFLVDLVGRIYEAALDPARWDEFLTALETIYPGSRVTLFRHGAEAPDAALQFYKNYGVDDLRAYTSYYAKVSPYLARGHKLIAAGRPIHYEALIGDPELFTTELYNDYMRPRRLGHYGTGVILEKFGGRKGTNLSLADHKDDPNRREHQLRLLELLTPHLVRAMQLHRMVSLQKASGDAAQAAFDHWPHAGFVMSADGCVVTFNRAAEILLARADALWLGRDQRLRSIDEARTAELEAAIRSCAALTTDQHMAARPPESLVLPRLLQASPLRAMISPLPPLDVGSGQEFGKGSVLLLLFDPDNVPRTSTDWMARQFGLTPAEQRLTEEIVNGVPLADAADALGIRLTTARTRLKAIQTKTHCHRQSDLVRLALSMPALRRD
jgi:DNA-binding CsgD family transcriptional regulator/PAS domain-containing protein